MKKFLFSFFIIIVWNLSGQDSYQIDILKTETPIHIDGNLDESQWSTKANYAQNFNQYFPSDSSVADFPTTIKMRYDDHNLYIGIECFSKGDDYVIPTLKRDFRAGGNDNITLLIDPFSDGINAFMFGVNPKGVMREGLISGGGTSLDGFMTNWDNKWNCEAKIHKDKWVAEIAIPFSTLRFNKSSQTWKFNAYRFDMQANERSTWIRIPRNQWIFNLGYMGEMKFEAPIQASGSRMSIIPYAINSISRDDENGIPTEFKWNVGGDAKISVTSGLNLDITANPDFSQVEVDRQVTNLSRFEIQFPEQRQFFLENADLFGSFGFDNINPFFSRRIGISKDTVTDDNKLNTIYGGLRLSGKLNSNWRVGLLSIQSQKDTLAGQPDNNYTVSAVQRRLGSRSNIGFIFVNRQGFGTSPNDAIDRYNRVIGVDYNLATPSNLWTGKTFLHRSFSVANSQNAYAHGLTFDYNKRKYLFSWTHEYVGSGYDAQTGFVSRTSYKKINPQVQYFFYPKESIINRSSLQLSYADLFQPTLGSTDRDIELQFEVEFLNNARMEIETGHNYVFLTDDFDPTGTDSQPLAAFTSYNNYFIRARYNSDNSKLFSFNINPYIGKYFDGTRYAFGGNLNIRKEPVGAISFNYNINLFDMNYLDEDKFTVLLGTRIDLTFTKKLFLTSFLQYNSQSKNTNINTRLQWRFAPVSDFFLVYSDNYYYNDPDNPMTHSTFTLRNRSLVAKFTYWLNV